MRLKISKLIAISLVLFACRLASAEVLGKVKTIRDASVHYKLFISNGYDPAQAYPAVVRP